MYNKTFINLNKFSTNWVKIAQLLQISKITILKNKFSFSKNQFGFLSIFNSNQYINFFYKNYLFFYFYFLYIKKNSLYKKRNFFIKNKKINNLLINSLFLVNLFLTKNNEFINFPILPKYLNLNFKFEKILNLENLEFKNSKNIKNSKNFLSFLFMDPEFLKKKPNFIYYYYNWLHLSWIQSKKLITTSYQTNFSFFSLKNDINLTTKYFFA